jgi:prolyl oligopeptidase PreP (S9A serine peptidase family)
MGLQDDPYLSLEDTYSDSSLEFVLGANKFSISALGDPTKSKTSQYSRILHALESDERIPFVSKLGKDSVGNDEVYNLWKDSNVSVGFVCPRLSTQEAISGFWCHLTRPLRVRIESKRTLEENDNVIL